MEVYFVAGNAKAFTSYQSEFAKDAHRHVVHKYVWCLALSQLAYISNITHVFVSRAVRNIIIYNELLRAPFGRISVKGIIAIR